MREFIVGIFLGVVLGVLLISAVGSRSVAYKQGQIDALNGNVKYELKKQPDGTTKWEHK